MLKAILSFILLFVVSGVSDARVVNRMVAVVGTEAITLSELDAFEARLKDSPPEITDQGRIFQDKKKILELFVEDKIFQKEVKRLGLDASDKEVAAEVATIRERLNINETDLKKMLKERGTTYAIYKDFLRRQIEQRRLITQEIRSNVTISKEDVLNYYHQNIAKAAPTIEYHTKHIFFNTTPSNEIEVRKKAEQIVKRGRSVENFGTLARQFSEGPEANSGGDIGWFSLDQVIPEFKNAITKLRPGEISDPFKTSKGIHVLQLVDLRQPSPPELDDKTKERIQNILFQERISVLLHQWIQQKKRPEDGYFVEILL